MKNLKVCCISDTHGMFREAVIPKCDILIHAGDITAYGRPAEIVDFNLWLGSLHQVKHKVVIAGNHDACLQEDIRTHSIFTNVHYLQNSSVELEGLTIFGSPMTPTFYNWFFMADRGEEIKQYWDRIPKCDILVTHGPAWGTLDQITKPFYQAHLGCEELAYAVERVKPKYHIFGHIHSSHGKIKKGKTTYINASLLDESYKMVYEPICFNVRRKV